MLYATPRRNVMEDGKTNRGYHKSIVVRVMAAGRTFRVRLRRFTHDVRNTLVHHILRSVKSWCGMTPETSVQIIADDRASASASYYAHSEADSVLSIRLALKNLLVQLPA